ncbi:DUF221-domain-containing protein [Hysterangium stoloniferum]|nr:DUF221-domain-containing protein [Hysterangium stoloniferum]
MSIMSDADLQAQAQSSSTASFVTALVFNAAIFGAEILAFTFIRKYFKTIYEPRTFLTAEDKRVQPLPQRFFDWPLAVWKADLEQIRIQNGLDAYMFVRFLRMMIEILLPIWFISWAVLMPVTSVNTGTGANSGLDKFTYGNISPNATKRYAAHIILAWLFTFYIMYVLHRELRQFISLRQHHLVDPVHSATAQANTVLVTGIPHKYLTEQNLIQLFKHAPGGVKKVWLNRELQDLPSLYDRRLAACNKLEAAENTLIKTALKIRRKSKSKLPKDDGDVEGDITVADRLVPRNKRPSHRLPPGPLPFSLPLIGKKVDTIEWARAEILETTALLEEQRDKEQHDESGKEHGSVKYPPLNSAFILFNQQIGAHIAAQSLTHHEPFRMVKKYIELSPDDVVWGNLGLNPYEASIRALISVGITAALILGWAIPVAFVGIVSNIHSLCTTYSWLAWLCKVPDVLIGIIQGILPAVLLAVLFMLLPIVLRLLARFEGIPTRTGIELSLMTRYFIFQVIHGFLIVSISSGIIAALPGLVKNPSGIPSLLATKLPSASTFFLTFIILQGLSGTAGGFLTIVPLVLYYVMMFILGSTPRSIFNIKYTLRDVAWGTLYPGVTLLVVITFGYSIISPIINGLGCFTFLLFYMLYKYQFIWQLDMPPSGDTGGLFFVKAIQHVFVGLYVQQICLCALFFLAQDQNNKAAAVPEGALMVLLIAITAFFNYNMNASYAPLLHSLPLTLADRSYGMPKDGEEAAHAHDHDDENNPHEEHVESDTVGLRPGAEDISKPKKSEPSDFEHPCVREPQRPIWLVSDPLGLGDAEAAAMNTEGVEASTIHATVDEKGNVEVSGFPPGHK